MFSSSLTLHNGQQLEVAHCEVVPTKGVQKLLGTNNQITAVRLPSTEAKLSPSC